MRNIRAVLLVGSCLPILIACGNTESSGSGSADDGEDALVEDATFLAVLDDGDGDGLIGSAATAGFVFAAGEEEVASVLDTNEGFARDCRLRKFEERVIAEYDTNGDGRLAHAEQTALREDFGPRPGRHHRFARHHRRARLHWIYDADNSGTLDEDERSALRADLEQRCEDRHAYLLDTYDEDDSGSLDEEEWAQIHEDLHARREAKRAAILDAFDLDGDGRLDFAERHAACQAWHEILRARRASAIEAYDEDGDGVLNDDEKAALREALKERVRGEFFGEQ